MFILCTTTESVYEAIQVLSKAEYILLDCEGRDLGCASGSLSLISLGTPHAAHIYLFDVLTLPLNALQLLFGSLLSLTRDARRTTKIVWDGRMDYAELLHSYSRPIENVLDLQLVDVLSRERRGQKEWARLGRFARCAFPMTEIRKLQLEEVHALNSMDGATEEHKVEGVERKDASVKSLHYNNGSGIWMQRPLSNQLLEYAASDIRRLSAIYDHFLKCGYLESRAALRQLSSIYVSMHHDTGKPDPENIFLRGPYLPLSIPLSIMSRTCDSNATIVDLEVDLETSRVCTACKRTMFERHFPFEQGADVGTKKVSKAKAKALQVRSAPRSAKCKLCTFIVTKAEYVEKTRGQADGSNGGKGKGVVKKEKTI